MTSHARGIGVTIYTGCGVHGQHIKASLESIGSPYFIVIVTTSILGPLGTYGDVEDVMIFCDLNFVEKTRNKGTFDGLVTCRREVSVHFYLVVLENALLEVAK